MFDAMEHHSNQKNAQCHQINSGVEASGLNARRVTRPKVSVSDAMAAGLTEIDAKILAHVSHDIGGGRDVFKHRELTMKHKNEIRAICWSVLNVVGFASVDKYLLNHKICELLKNCMDTEKVNDRIKPLYARRLRWVYSAPEFLDQALVQYESLSLNCPITLSWLKGGGWRAHWYALDFVDHPGFKHDIPLTKQCTLHLSCDTCIALALGYVTMNELLASLSRPEAMLNAAFSQKHARRK
jgi:hypothetical protein